MSPTFDPADSMAEEALVEGIAFVSDPSRHPAASALYLRDCTEEDTVEGGGFVFSGRNDGNGGASRSVLKVQPSLFIMSLSSSGSATARKEWKGKSFFGFR